MQVVAASAHRGRLDQLLAQVFRQLDAQKLAGAPDLGCLFLSNHFEDEAEVAARRVRQTTGVGTLIGCTGEGIIGPTEEYEQEPAVSLLLASLPGHDVQPAAIEQARLEAAADRADWRKLFHVAGERPASFLLFGDPFSLDVNAMLRGVNQFLPGCALSGGLASGAEAPGQSALIIDDDVMREGAVAARLAGPPLDTVVSQGCRPIGQPFVITRGEGNVIHQLGGRKPLDVLKQIFHEAPTSERELMQRGVFLGRVINEHQERFHRGDFLIRNLVAADEDSGAIAIGDHARTGTTIQFQVRDADTADEDMRILMSARAANPPRGMLLFSCNGRGTRLFPQRNHDVNVVRDKLGPIPLAGFFCAGELGPIGGKNFIHGHTASMALLG